MAQQGILDSLFGGGSTEVQIPAPPLPKPKPVEDKPFDIEKAKLGLGKFPPQQELFINAERQSGHITNFALAKLISPSGYTLQDVQDLWGAGDISDRGTYTVITSGLLPPRETLRYVYSAELLSPNIPPLPRPTMDAEVVRYLDFGQSFVVNVPQGFHPYVFCSGFTQVEGLRVPSELADGVMFLQLIVKQHSPGATKSDNSVDHTFTFALRVATLVIDTPAIPAGHLRFVARAELL